MKIIVSIIGLLTVLIGAWPMVRESSLVPESIKFVPSAGVAYQIIIILIGILGLLYGMKSGKVKVK